MAGKQAKTLSDQQIKAVLHSLAEGRNAVRNRVIFLLSLHSLRAKEVASLELSMVTDAEGNLAAAITLEDKASKGRSGRTIYMNEMLRKELAAYLLERKDNSSQYVIVTERSDKFSAHAVVVLFQRLYKRLGFEGLSSHSGRRSCITRAARKIALVGGSLRDVQQMAGHRALSTTQRYIDGDSEAQKKVVNLLF